MTGSRIPIGDDTQPHAAEMVKELVEFVRVPNNVFVPGQIQENALLLRRMMERRGIQVELWPTPSDRPLVFGELLTPGATRTILIYGHYDGVPAEAAQWHSDPYDPVLRKTLPRADADDWSTMPWPADGRYDGEWRLFGRSAADSKNGIVAVLTALDVLQAGGRPPGVNLKFLFDGEEEVESPGLAHCLEQNRHRLQADCVMPACGETHQSGLPTVQLGVRGILQFDLTVYTTAVDMHSGHFGGFAPNAVFQMTHLLTSMKDEDGLVRIPGFYDDVVPLTPEEIEAVKAIPTVEESVCRQCGIARPEGGGRKLQELVNLPTLNVRGIGAGFLGQEARNIVPGRATAEFDVRLVKGMDPDRTLGSIVAHMMSLGWTVLDHDPTLEELRASERVARVTKKAGFPAVRTPLSSPVAAYVVNAVKRAVGSDLLVLPTEGGSLPMYLFERIGLPLIGLPPSNYDCNQHTHDENLKLSYLFRAVQVFAAVFEGGDVPSLRF